MAARRLSCVVAVCLAALAVSSASSSDDFDWARIELQPVAGRALLQAADAAGSNNGGYGGSSGGGYGGYGGYGSGARRRLIEAGSSSGGGYGGYGSEGAYGGGGYGAGPRQLLELEPVGADDEALQAQAAERAAEEEQQEAARVASAAAAAERRAQQQQQEQRRQQQEQEQEEQQQQSAAKAAPSAAVAAALRGAHAAAAAAALSPRAGTCYCRYDADYATWALGEDACKAALYAKCAASQLPCAWLDAYYNHASGAALAHALPHEADILGFVFDDCQPRPPCACAGVKFDGADAVASAFACCRDLRAACRTPFNGLACADVEAFCRDDEPSAKLLHWAQHKLHRGVECADYEAVPYAYVPLAGAGGEEADEATDAGEQQQQQRRQRVGGAAAAPAAGARVATAAVGLGAALVLAAVAGMAATLRGGSGDDAADEQHGAPLLHSIPEVPGADEADAPRPPLRVVSSSAYLGPVGFVARAGH